MNNPGEQYTEKILAESLELILSGRASLESILKSHPELSEELTAEVETATWISSRSYLVKEDPAFVQKSKQRLMARVAKEPAETRPQKSRQMAGQMSRQFWIMRLAGIAAVLVLLFASLSGTVYASQSALPGEDLYSVKRWSEEVRYSLAGDSESKFSLTIELSQRRLDEAETLVNQGKLDHVPSALEEYQHEVDLALENSKGVKTASHEALAGQFDAAMAANKQQLTHLLDHSSSPDASGVRSAIEDSISTSLLARKAIEGTLGKNTGGNGAPDGKNSATQHPGAIIPAKTPEGVGSKATPEKPGEGGSPTKLPAEKTKPAGDDYDQVTGNPTKESESTQPAVKVTPTAKDTKEGVDRGTPTARPTEKERPTKESPAVKPTQKPTDAGKTGGPGEGGNPPQPTKEDKPGK